MKRTVFATITLLLAITLQAQKRVTEGPWADPIGKPLIPGNWGFIDPTVFIDDDGQAWLFWGNNGCWYAKLNEDMISIDTSFADNGFRRTTAFREFQRMKDGRIPKIDIEAKIIKN